MSLAIAPTLAASACLAALAVAGAAARTANAGSGLAVSQSAYSCYFPLTLQPPEFRPARVGWLQDERSGPVLVDRETQYWVVDRGPTGSDLRVLPHWRTGQPHQGYTGGLSRCVSELAVDAGFVYALSCSNLPPQSLTIVDATDPYFPHVEGSVALTGQGLAVKGGIAYVGQMEKRGVTVVDARDPARPAVVRETGEEQGDCCGTSLALNGKLLYMARPDLHLSVFDIRDPLEPTLRTRLPIAGEPGESRPVLLTSGEGKLFAVFGTKGGTGAAVRIFDTPESGEPQLVGSLEGSAALINGPEIVAAGQHRLYVAQSYGGGKVTVFDTEPPTRLRPVGAITTTYPRGLAVSPDGDTIVVSEKEKGLHYFRRSATDPEEVGRLGVMGSVIHASVQGTYAYLSTSNGMSVVDLADPLLPEEIGRASFEGLPRWIKASGGRAYQVVYHAPDDHPLLLVTYDISDPTRPLVESNYPIRTSHRYQELGLVAIDEADGLVWLVDVDDNLKSVDTSAPTDPVEVSATALSYKVVDMALSPGVAWLVALTTTEGPTSCRLVGVDISDPISPRVVSDVAYDDSSNCPEHLSVDANMLYGWLDHHHLVVHDVSDLADPEHLSKTRFGWITSLMAAESIVYVVRGTDLVMISVQDPARPHEIGVGPLPFASHLSDVSGGLVYLAPADGLSIVDPWLSTRGPLPSPDGTEEE